MQVIESTKTVYVDVDDTLIFWKDTMSNNDWEHPITINGELFDVNTRLTSKLGTLHAAGYTIILWSQGGGQWAKEVAEALDVAHLVTLCISKPMFYYDDLPSEKWMPHRIDPFKMKKPGLDD